MNELTGRVALVTGASRGIGRMIARRLASAGASVAAGARELNAEPVVAEIVEAGGVAEALTLDVADRENVTAAVGIVFKKFGRIDILVNNAGIVRDQLMLRMTSEDWEAVLTTNLTGAFTCARAVLPKMLKQRFGRVINITSVVGQSGNAGQVNYAASKAGLIGFTKALAREIATRGITVNAVAPGMIDTDMTASLEKQTREALAAQIPVGRFGTGNDVAGAVCFLASNEASYITGQVLGVNGGMYM